MNRLIPRVTLFVAVGLVLAAGTELKAQLSVSKSSIAFGSVAVAGTKTDSFYVKNDSSQALNVTAGSSTNARFVLTAKSGNVVQAIAANDSAWYYVAFNPTTVGSEAGNIELNHDAPASTNPLVVAVTGSSPNFYSFHSGTTKALITARAMVDTFAGRTRIDSVFITNFGSGSVNVTSITFDNPEFQVLTATPFALNVGDTTLIQFSYTASVVGRDTDTLRVNHDGALAGSSPVNLVVRARGLGSFRFSTSSAFAGGPLDTHVVRIHAANTGITPGTVFPAVAVDSSRPLRVFMRNNGEEDLRVDSIKFSTPHFYSTMPVPFTQKDDPFNVYQLRLDMVYQPQDLSAPTHKDTMILYTNDPIPGGNAMRLAVEGASRNAVYVRSSTNATSIAFGIVNLGVVAQNHIRVYNYTVNTLTVDSVSTAQGNSKFVIVPGYQTSLSQGDTSRIYVQFAPTDTLPNTTLVQADTFLVYLDGSAIPTKMPATGRVTQAIAFVPSGALVNVGQVLVDASRDTTIRVYNRTPDPYRIDSLVLVSGNEFTIQSNSLLTNLPAGDSTEIVIRFQPTAGGIINDTLKIWHNFPAGLLANPRLVTVRGEGSTQGIILASNFITVDNVEGTEGVAISSSDSSYSEVGNFWNNFGGSFGTGHRRSPNLSGSHFGSAATYRFKVDSGGPYLVYHWMLNSPNVGGRFFVHFRKFGIGGIYDSTRYNIYENRTLIPGYSGTWKPLFMHWVDGVGPGAAYVTIGADGLSGGFLRVDAIRFLRTQQVRDIEFGRRDFNFTSNRVPEEFPEVTLGDEVVRDYPIYNLGTDTLTITDIKFFSTNAVPAPRFSVKNFTPGTPIKIPPMTLDGISEVGGIFNLQLAFRPFQEEFVRDSMVIVSNDDSEPNAYIILNAQGINYYFIMNASLGNTEPHFRASNPGEGGVTTIPRYIETANGSWLNSTLAGVTYPIPGGNSASRVNVGGAATLPHQAIYEFELPDIAFGQIPTDGRYILEYGGPSGSTNAYSATQVIVTQTFGVPPDTGVTDTRTTTLAADLWKQVGGGLKTFFMTPGGKITTTFNRTAATDAGGGAGFLRTDLLRVRKVPTGPQIAASVADPDSVVFADVNFRNPGGIDGQANRRTLTLGSRGESALNVTAIFFRNGQYFSVANPPSLPLQLPAVSGQFDLVLQFNPDKIAPRFRDTLEVQSNSSRGDSVFLVPVTGIGIGGTFIVDDDRPTPTEVFASPTVSGLWLGGWATGNLQNWQRDVFNTPNQRGFGPTRALLPIYRNPNTAHFEWYPLLPVQSGESDSILVNIAATVGITAAKASPAARYKVFSTGGNITKDTLVNQGGRAAGPSGAAEINLGNHYFLRGGRDAQGGAAIFGHIRLENDTAAVTAFYGNSNNVARTDTFGLIADAVILRELEFVSPLVGVQDEAELPTEYALSQNYPNPFNPTTTIRFALPERVTVDLKVYDLLGREVRSLVHGDAMNPGNHVVVWDGRNSAGHQVSTGVYFYRIIAGGYIQSKKMMLLK